MVPGRRGGGRLGAAAELDRPEKMKRQNHQYLRGGGKERSQE